MKCVLTSLYGRTMDFGRLHGVPPRAAVRPGGTKFNHFKNKTVRQAAAPAGVPRQPYLAILLKYIAE